MLIDVRIKYVPYPLQNLSQEEIAMEQAEEQMKKELWKFIEPYVKREVSNGHVRLFLYAKEGEELGFDIKNYETCIHKYLKINEPDNE